MRKMSTYARKRRHVDPLAGMRAISGMTPFTQAEQASLNLPVRLAWQAFCEGMAQGNDFDTLACVVNVSLIRAESIGSAEIIEACKLAQDSLMRIIERKRKTGKFGLNYQDREDIPPILDMHEQLIELSTPKQMMDALQEVLNRLNSGKTLGDGYETEH